MNTAKIVILCLNRFDFSAAILIFASVIIALNRYNAAIYYPKNKTGMEKETMTMKQRLADIYLDISWRELSRNYFDKSVSWLYNKMNGRDGNGGKGDFTKKEAEQLKGALIDLSERIRKCAETI